MKTPFVLAFLALSLPSVPAAIVWTGATSSDVFDNTNWDFSGSTVTSVAVNVSILDDVRITGATASIPNVTGQGRFQLGNGFTLLMDNATLKLDAGGNDGVGGEPSSTGITVNLTNGSRLEPFFIVNGVTLNIDGTSSATFGGGGIPINLSTVNLSPGASLAFLLEPPANFRAEHLSKVFVNGSPAVEGVNIQVSTFNGASGSIVTVVPEPSGLAFLGLAGLAAGLRRKR